MLNIPLEEDQTAGIIQPDLPLRPPSPGTLQSSYILTPSMPVLSALLTQQDLQHHTDPPRPIQTLSLSRGTDLNPFQPKVAPTVVS